MFKETPFIPHSGRYIAVEDLMFERNVIWIQGRITPDMIDSLFVQLALLEEKFSHDIENFDTNVITVCINSPGGCLCQAMNFAEALIASPYQVRTVITGYAYSAAALIAMAGDEDKRVMFTHSMLMIHEPYYAKDNISDESVESVEYISNNLQKFKQMTIDYVASRTKMTKTNIKKAITNRKLFMDADMALEAGVISSITERFFLKE